MINEDIKVFRPFGPTVAKLIIPNNIIQVLNKYIDENSLMKKKLQILIMEVSLLELRKLMTKMNLLKIVI